MNILITGGNSYIGKSIYNSLSNKHNIILAPRNILDLTNRYSVDKFFNENHYFDFIIHTAVKGINRFEKESLNILDDNLNMYYNICDKQSHFNKFISFGSGVEIFPKNTLYTLSKKVISESIKNKENFYNLRIFAVFDENELNTRFIKSNLLRYINHQAIEIYETKKMDFFYMKDLINLVEYYIENKNPPKEVNCSYKEKYSLFEIANIINQLDKHKVEIKNETSIKDDYIGEYNLPISYKGLEKGIIEVYKKIKQKTID